MISSESCSCSTSFSISLFCRNCRYQSYGRLPSTLLRDRVGYLPTTQPVMLVMGVGMGGASSPLYGSSAPRSTSYIILSGCATMIGTVSYCVRAAQSCLSTWMSELSNATTAFVSKDGSYSSSRAVVGPTSSSSSITPGSSGLISGNGASSPMSPWNSPSSSVISSVHSKGSLLWFRNRNYFRWFSFLPILLTLAITAVGIGSTCVW